MKKDEEDNSVRFVAFVDVSNNSSINSQRNKQSLN